MANSVEHCRTLLHLNCSNLQKDPVFGVISDIGGGQGPVASTVAADKAHGRSASNTNINVLRDMAVLHYTTLHFIIPPPPPPPPHGKDGFLLHQEINQHQQ
jgi:hypothetical protein